MSIVVSTEKEEDYSRKNAMPINFATLNQLILKDLKTNKTSASGILGSYKRQDILRFLEAPAKNEKQLRNISISLYNKSLHFKRLVQYFSKMLTLDYIVEPVNIDYDKLNAKTFSNQYKKTLQFLDTMNIKHEFSKILGVAYREDVFFGYEHMGNNSYFIQKLNPDYCMISSLEDGVYNVAYDFTYFSNNLEQLETFPKEFKSKYNAYLKNKDLRWQELDSTKTICIKINEDIDYQIPPFVGAFDALFDIEDYKALRKDRQKISNYKVLIQKLPIREDSDENNDFLIDYDNMMMFHNKAAMSLPDEVGLITSPMEIKDISFDKDSSDRDNVAQATSDYWRTTGVSGTLFDADKAGSIGLEASIKTDEIIAFAVLRQVERWINRRLKFFMSNTSFKIRMLNTTENNHMEVFETAFSAAQFGFPTKMMAMAALGFSPSAVMNMSILENDILKFTDRFIPLQSANTTSSDEGGAPKKKAKKLSTEGAEARDK